MTKYYTLKLTEHQVAVMLHALANESSGDDDTFWYYYKVYRAVAKKCAKEGFVNEVMIREGIV